MYNILAALSIVIVRFFFSLTLHYKDTHHSEDRKMKIKVPASFVITYSIVESDAFKKVQSDKFIKEDYFLQSPWD